MEKKSKIRKQLEAEQREKRKEDGFFDGRFKTKVVQNKKKYKRNTDDKIDLDSN